jgi:hypothetical protein
MPELLLPFDPYGVNPANLITNEEFILTPSINQRGVVVMPIYAPFFVDDFILKLSVGPVQKILQEGTDFVLSLYYLDGSESSGKLLYGACSMVSCLLQGTLFIQYRSVGGTWTTYRNAALEKINSRRLNAKLTLWDGLFESLPLFPEIIRNENEQARFRELDLVNKINSMANDFPLRNTIPTNTPHLEFPNNPHRVTLESLGYSVATPNEIEAGLPTPKLITYRQASSIVSGRVPFVNVPTITSCVSSISNGISEITLTSSIFETTNCVDSHYSSNWQLSTDINFSHITHEVLNNRDFLTSIAFSNQRGLTVYYARVCYRAVSGRLSNWSIAASVTTLEIPIIVNKPTIIFPLYGATNQPQSLIVLASNFSINNADGTHLSSDWQLSTDPDFLTLIINNPDDIINKNRWPIDSLLKNADYFLRVRYKSLDLVYSDWSDIAQFSITGSHILAPSILNPLNNSVSQPKTITCQSSAFSTNDGGDAHFSSTWELATDQNFQNIFQRIDNSQSNKTTWVITDLVSKQVYYLRVKYFGISYDESEWSNAILFTEEERSVIKPTINYPVNGSIDFPKSLTITSSVFDTVQKTDTHRSSTWQLSTSVDFMTLVDFSENSTINKTTWPVANLLLSHVYYIRVKYTGETSGDSPWSNVVSFATATEIYPMQEIAIIQPTNPIAGQLFGDSISFSSNKQTIAIGSPMDLNTNGKLSGCVHIFITENQHSWINEARIEFNEETFSTYDRFGECIALSGNGLTLAVITAEPHLLHVFVKASNSWSKQARIELSSNLGNYSSKVSLSILEDGLTIIIGIPGADVLGIEDSGFIIIYKNTNGTWAQQGQISAQNPVAHNFFGISTKISKDGITLATSTHVPFGIGRIYFYKLTGANWAFHSFLNSPTDQIGDVFIPLGFNSNGNLFIASKYNGISYETYIYRASGTTWEQEAVFPGSDIARINSAGNVVIIKNNSTSAKVYVFKNNSWSFKRLLTANFLNYSENQYSDYLSEDGSTLAIGIASDYAAQSETNCGVVHIFK